MTFDPEYLPGARNAIETCLRIQAGEKVTLITDYACREIAAAFEHELRTRRIPHHVFVLEELAERPLAHMPAPALTDLETSQVSIFAVRAQEKELASRMEMTEVVNRRKNAFRLVSASARAPISTARVKAIA